MNKMLQLKKNVMGNWIKDDWQGKTKENVDYSSRVLILAGLNTYYTYNQLLKTNRSILNTNSVLKTV